MESMTSCVVLPQVIVLYRLLLRLRLAGAGRKGGPGRVRGQISKRHRGFNYWKHTKLTVREHCRYK